MARFCPGFTPLPQELAFCVACWLMEAELYQSLTTRVFNSSNEELNRQGNWWVVSIRSFLQEPRCSIRGFSCFKRLDEDRQTVLVYLQAGVVLFCCYCLF